LVRYARPRRSHVEDVGREALGGEAPNWGT